jgi:hypothetical protein
MFTTAQQTKVVKIPVTAINAGSCLTRNQSSPTVQNFSRLEEVSDLAALLGSAS